MENNIIKQLNIYYYGMIALALIAGTITFYLIINEILLPLDRMSEWGKGIQSFVIIWALVTIPGGLFWCKQRCKTIAAIEDDTEKMLQYRKAAALRIVLVSSGMTFAIVAFYWMSCYQSMLWVAAMSAIGWYFTKPTEKKMYMELHPEVEQY